jgi:hypothetical protein
MYLTRYITTAPQHPTTAPLHHCEKPCTLLLLDFIGCIKITFTQLSLLAVIIALILIPFASKIKIFNIEFERREKDK